MTKKAEKRSDKLKKAVTQKFGGRQPPCSSGSEEDILLEQEDGHIINSKDLSVKTSEMLPHLKISKEEGAFMALVSKGNVNGVAAFLRAHPGFNINCQNYRGHTPLFKAVQNEDEPMVKYLVSLQDIHLKDEVLHCIQQGNVAIVELLLSKQIQTTIDGNEYTDDITPLILAAHCDDYEIIRLLLERGHMIEKPHFPTCFCKKKCRGRKKGESLTESRARISIYKALAGPCYMALTASDPILTAFLLSDELIQCASIEKEFVNDYMQLSAQCSQFALDLLDQCKKSEEVQILLECREGSLILGGRPMRFPRIGLALDFGQKNFVAHSNCQQILRTAWLAEWGDWKSLSSAGKLLRVVPRIILLPIIALVYLFFPCTKLAKSLGSPIKKFLTGTASYLVFLMILAAQHELNRKDARRGPPTTGLEVPIVIYLVGFLWLEIKQAWILGWRRYSGLWWNRYDLIMIGCFTATFSCWLWSSLAIEEEDYHWERKFWNQYDPTLISEGLMAVATVLAFGRILYILQVHRDLGPLQVSISRMFKDVATFMAIFAIVMGSFTMGMSSLYQYYKGHRRVDAVGRKYYQIPSFVNLQSTLKTLFWGIFAMSPSDAADVVIENIGGNSTHPVFNKHKFTEGIGYTLFSIYHIITVIVLLNLLIAMMSDTYQKVQNNADVEWKFARTRVWLSYFEEGGTLPPPFNLIPSPKAIFDVFLWILNVMRADRSAKCSFRRCCYYEDDFDEEQLNASYQILITKLIRRYLRSKEEDKKHRQVALSDLKDIKHEIKELKKMTSEVQEALKNTLQTRSSARSLLPDTASNVFLVDPPLL